ncbi:MAG: hypothetical protein AAF614_06290 [Chloroflexota bacterium]
MLRRFLLFTVVVLLVACGGEELPSDGPLVVSEDSVVGQSLADEAATPTLAAPVVETVEAPATAVSVTEPTSLPVQEGVGADGAGADEELSGDLPTSLAVGESVGVLLSGGELAAFSFMGTQFEPIMFFAEAAEGLDLSLQIYGETVADAPLREADFSGDGWPEIMVFSPQTTGLFHVAIQAATGAGEASVSAYAGGMDGVAVSQQGILAAGQSQTYEVSSNNGRPVVAYVDPVEQADLQIIFTISDGSAVAEANFGSGGSAEASFVLPLETTPYTITISEVNGAEATYDIVIVTLD